MMANNIKLVIFDLDDTLSDTSSAFRRAKHSINSVLDELNIEQNAFWARHDVMAGAMYQQAVDCRLPWAEYRRLRFLLPLDGQVDDPDGIAEHINNLYMKEINYSIQLFDDVFPTFEILNEMGIRKVLLTNGPSSGQRSKIKSCRLEEHLDAIYISDELQCAKPERKIFGIVLSAENADPSHTIMIGDSRPNDIEGAKNAGIRSILVDRFDIHGDFDGCKIKHLTDIKNYL